MASPARFQALAVVLLLLAAPPTSADVPFTIVAAPGQSVPGLPGVTFGQSIPWTLSNTGQVAITANLVGPGFDPDDIALFSGPPDALQFIVRDDQLPPALPNPINNTLIAIAINDTGQVIFESAKSLGPQTLWISSGSTFQPIAAPGQVVPGLGPSDVYNIIHFRGDIHAPNIVNSRGEIFYASTLNQDDSFDRIALFAGTAGDTRLITAPGQPLSILGPGVTLAQANIAPFHTTISNAGEVAFSAHLQGPSIDGNNYGALIMTNPTRVVARVGQPAPGLPGETFRGVGFEGGFRHFQHVAVTPGGRIRFIANVTSENDNDFAFYVGDPASPSLVALGGPELVRFPASNDADQVAYVRGTLNDSAVITGTPGNLRVVALGGQQAPGLPAGIIFTPAERDDDEPRIRFGPPLLNARGQVAFTSRLSDVIPIDENIINTSNDVALFATDFSGNLQFILREGDPFSLSPTDAPIISRFEVHAFNDLGQIAIRLHFNDNRTASILATIPEPALLPLLIFTTSLLRRRPRRRASPAFIATV